MVLISLIGKILISLYIKSLLVFWFDDKWVIIRSIRYMLKPSLKKKEKNCYEIQKLSWVLGSSSQIFFKKIKNKKFKFWVNVK